MRTAFAAGLLLASWADALPEISIAKRDRHSNGRSRDVARGLLKRDAGTLETNVFDILTYSTGGAYYANITVGSPPQPQTVIVDTGSSDLYFDASNAATCASNKGYGCTGGTFTPGKSKDYEVVAPAPSFNTSFGDGSTANGPYATDEVCIDNICVSDVQFGVATEVTSTTGYAIGLMGVGYSANEATRHDYPNIPEVLKDAGVINSRLYSVYLNDEGATSGSILFGGIDTNKYTGPLQTFDILPDLITERVDQFITSVTALSVKVGGGNHHIFSGGAGGVGAYRPYDKALPVLLDTGSSAWSVPASYYPYIAEPFTYVNREGICSCAHADSGDSITLQFGGKLDITVSANEFIVPIFNATTKQPLMWDEKNQACAFMIVPSKGTGMGFDTLGDAVLRSMYLVYDLDQGQLSLAQAKLNNLGSSNVKTVAAGPSGVANAAKNYHASPGQNFSIAAEISATAKYQVSTAKTAIGTATGTAAVPGSAQPTQSGKGGAIPLGNPGTGWSSISFTAFLVSLMVIGAGVMM